MSSYIVAGRQIESQAAQAQDDFLRGQRQEVYSEFLAAVLSAREKVDIIADRVSDGPTTEEQIPALMEDLNAVTVLNEEIQLIGGDGTRSSAAT
jgi:hypothetical protein